MSKASKACDISPKVRKEVMERDGGACIVCGSMQGIQIAHFISRARLGLGCSRNLACMCHKCHAEMDNGKYHKEYQTIFERHLRAHYTGWDKEKLTYRKWGRE